MGKFSKARHPGTSQPLLPRFLIATGFCGLHGGTKNGTSGARIKILRPLFNTNQPPKTPKRHLRDQNRTSKSYFWSFDQFCIFLRRFPISTGPIFQTSFPPRKRRPIFFQIFCAISVHKKAAKTPSPRFWKKLPHDNTLY